MQLVLMIVIVAAAIIGANMYGPDGVVVGVGFVFGCALLMFAWGMLGGARQALFPPKARESWMIQAQPDPIGGTVMLIAGLAALAAVWYGGSWIYRNLM